MTFGTLRHQRALGLDATLIEATRMVFESSLPPIRGQHRKQQTDFGSTLGSTIESYLKDREHVWTAKTHLMSAAALRLFIEILRDQQLTAVTRQACRNFREIVLRLPPNMGKRFRGQTMSQVLALSPKPMSTKNANKIVSSVSAFFSWSVQEELLASNPAKGLTLRIKHSPDTERDAFSTADLKLLFERSPVYAGCLSNRHRNQLGDQIIRDAKFWLPLIAVHSGMRLEEIAQLQVHQLSVVDGVWVFDINRSEDNRLKTPQSQRQVPVHPLLIAAGLLDHRKQIGAGHLWPDLFRGNDGFFSSPFSKWFGRYKHRIGLTNPKLTFHSFRHTAINHLKQAGVEETLIKELVGHANRSITMSRYGKPLNAKRMLTIVEKLRYEIDLEKLLDHSDAINIEVVPTEP
jgi:integrase